MHGVRIGKSQPALLRLTIEFRENCNFDRACLWEDVIGMQQEFLSAGEIKDCQAQYPIQVAINLADVGFQLFPENLLFLGLLWSGRSLRTSTRNQQ